MALYHAVKHRKTMDRRGATFIVLLAQFAGLNKTETKPKNTAIKGPMKKG